MKRKSTNGTQFLFHGGAVAWGSKRQRATALSTSDAEFYATSKGSKDAIWFRALLFELGIDTGTIPIFCESKCARSMIEDPENNQRVKHIDVKFSFVRDHQEQGTIKIEKIYEAFTLEKLRKFTR